jgi:hypothetical protein
MVGKEKNMDNCNELKHFKFWCQKILPLVYDDSLSYYEVLCKVVDYINKLIDDENSAIKQIAELKKELEVVQKWIADFNTSFAEEIIKKYLATMIFVEISDSGYIVYYIPERWEDIQFETTGLDVEIPNTDYGKLVLSY